MHLDHKTFTLLPSVEIRAFHLIYHLRMVAGLESQASLNLSTLNHAKAFSVISITSLNLMMMIIRRRRSSGLTTRQSMRKFASSRPRRLNWIRVRLVIRRLRIQPRRVGNNLSWRFDHEIFSTVILSFPLILEGQLSVSGEIMCTILVNHLED